MSHFRKILISVRNLPELTFYVQYIHSVRNRLNEVSEIGPHTHTYRYLTDAKQYLYLRVFLNYLVHVREYKISRR